MKTKLWNPKGFWNYSRHFTKSSSSIDVFVDECGSKIHDDSEKADLLSKFLASTFTDDPDIVTSLPLPETQNTHLLLDIDISPLMVRDKLVKLKANKAGGPEKISSNVLGECKNFDVFGFDIQPVHSIRLCFTGLEGCRCQSLIQKGSRLACSNYSPISLTSHNVKLLEMIILSHILELTRKNNTFSCDQHGFQEKCSCIYLNYSSV